MASIYSPSYSTTYEDSNIVTQITTISTLSIGAYQTNSNLNTLTVGASSNVNIQAGNSVNVYVNSNNAFNIYTTNTTGSNIIPMFSVQLSNNQTVMSACNFTIALSGTTAIGNAQLLSSNNYQIFSTSNALGFVFNNDVNVSSNIIINDNITSYKNIACAGNIFGNTVNMFTTTPNTTTTSNLTRVGYSFHVNPYNQLEILRTDQLNSNNTLVSKIQRIMTFGNTEFNNQLKGNPDNYNVMRQFSGINGNYSNGSTPGMTDIKWSPIVNTSNIYYSTGFVGIGTNNPLTKLHVAGNITIEGNIIPKTTTLYDLGTPSNRFRDIYLSGNTIDLAGSMISLSSTGSFNFLDSNGSPTPVAGWTTNNANIYIISSNVGINTSTPQYPLDINGAINAIGYCNLLIDNASSLSTTNAPTSRIMNQVYQIAVNASNMIYANGNATNAINNASNALVIAIAASNTTFSLSAQVVSASNSATSALTTAIAASNVVYLISTQAVSASNSATSALTTAIAASNVAYSVSAQAVSASNSATSALETAIAASNVAIIANNKAIYASNLAITLSNTSYNNSALIITLSNKSSFSSNLAINLSNNLISISNITINAFNLANNNSNLIELISNKANFSSNLAIENSNYTYTLSNVSQNYATSNVAYFASNLAITACNTSIFASNLAIENSNLLTILSNTYIATSNVAITACNTSIFASNLAITISNYTYTLSNTSQDHATSNIAYNALALAIIASNIATTAKTLSILNEADINDAINIAIQASNIAVNADIRITDLGWSNYSSNIFTIGSNIGIGKSNPQYLLDVNGPMSATNISLRLTSGIINITSTPTIFTSLNSNYIGKFCKLYIGPTLDGEPFYAHSFAFWNNAYNSTTIATQSSNNNITITTLKSNIQISTNAQQFINNSISKYPSFNMTSNISSSSNSTNSYIASASAYYLNIDIYNAYNAFNSTALYGWWGENNAYDGVSGLYISGTQSSTSNIIGDWLELELPNTIILTSYWIDPSLDAYSIPTTWYIHGSSDNSTWNILDVKTSYNWNERIETEFQISNNTSSYKYYRLTTTKILPNGYTVYIKKFAVSGGRYLQYPWSLYIV